MMFLVYKENRINRTSHCGIGLQKAPRSVDLIKSIINFWYEVDTGIWNGFEHL